MSKAEAAIRKAFTGHGWVEAKVTQQDAKLTIEMPVDALVEFVLDELIGDEDAVLELARDAGWVGPHDCPECGAQDICIVPREVVDNDAA